MKKFFSLVLKFPSVLVIILACLTIIQVHLNLSRYKSNDVIKWDVIGYYSYLPAVFIDNDVSLRFINPENQDSYSGIKYGYVDDVHGNHIIKYSMGMSILYSPFFFLAHILSTPLGYASDGFSDIYEFFIEFSGLFYLLLGFYFLRKLLLRFYDEKVAAVSICLVFFGTNLLYYSTVEAAMSHAYTFSLFSIMLYFSVEAYQNLNLKNAIILAICYGLIILIRPINVLLIIPFLFFNVNTIADIKNRFSFYKQNLKFVIVFLIISFFIVSFQFFYYKYVTGNYFVFSYGKERFYFNHFHLVDILFSFRKGWLVYTPIMFFALFGIFKMKLNSEFKTSIFILLPIYLYMVSSWWCWWYGGSYSQRSLIDIYPLLSLPLASFITYVMSFTKKSRQITFAGFTLLVLLSIIQTVQYKYNIIDFDGMTAKEYIHVFGSIDDKSIDTTLLKKPNYDLAILGLENE